MAREKKALPLGWETQIPEAIWPQTLVSAVLLDPGALATDRSVESLRKFRAWAEDPSHPEHSEGKKWLERLGKALLPPTSPLDDDGFDLPQEPTQALPFSSDGLLPAGQESGELTVDAFLRPPKRQVLKPLEAEENEQEITDPRTPSLSASIEETVRPRAVSALSADDAIISARQTTGASAPPTAEFADEEPPTTALPRVDSLPASGALPKAPPPAPEVSVQIDDEDKPTRYIHLPKELAKAKAQEESAPEHTEMAVLSNAAQKSLAAPPPTAKENKRRPSEAPAGPKSNPRQPELKGNVVRRIVRSGPPKPSKPRASMAQVRGLYPLLLPFVRELVPLRYERRSRRFWARWREVAGDRGVRREVVEELLKSAQDERSLVCELIAEVQSVEPKTVYPLVAKLENESLPDQPASLSSERRRGPLVGASVRVEGVFNEE